VTRLLRAELLKHRSTATTLALAGVMLALVTFAVVLHGFGFEADGLATRADQLSVLFAWGDVLGALFAALLGAMTITGEIRHGTMRPTFLVTPDRGRVVVAKVLASMLLALAFGSIAGLIALGFGSWVLSARDIGNELGGSDVALLVLGGAGAVALWAAIGVGLGAVVRQPVLVLVGISGWLLFVENLLVAYVPDAGRLMPGAAAAAVAGLNPDTLLAPAAGAILLVAYATAATGAGWIATTRRDVA
jgi:ABC-2 type transport system permease protein